MGNLTSSDMIDVYHNLEVGPALAVLLVLFVFNILLNITIAVIACHNLPCAKESTQNCSTDVRSSCCVSCITSCCARVCSIFEQQSDREPNSRKTCCQDFRELYYKFWKTCVTTIFIIAVKTKKGKNHQLNGDARRQRAAGQDNTMLFAKSASDNPKDDVITCFFVGNQSRAHCAYISENELIVDVICYALNQGNEFNAVGIAFGVSSVIITGSQLYFMAVLRTCYWIKKKCCVCCCISVQMMGVIGLLAAILTLVLWPYFSVTKGGNDGHNFFYAQEPLRWIQYGLVCFTVLSVLLVPSCVFPHSTNCYTNVNDYDAV